MMIGWVVAAILAVIAIYAVYKHLNAPERRLKRRVLKRVKAVDDWYFNELREDGIEEITIKRATELFGIPGSTLRDWARKGMVKARKEGRKWLIEVGSLKSKLEEKQ